MAKINVVLDKKAKDVVQKTANFSGGSGDIKVVDELPSTKKDSLYIKRNTIVIPPREIFTAHSYQIIYNGSSYSSIIGQYLVVSDEDMISRLYERITERLGDPLPDNIREEIEFNIMTQLEWESELASANATIYYINSEEELANIHKQYDLIIIQDLGEVKLEDIKLLEEIHVNEYPSSPNIYALIALNQNSLLFQTIISGSSFTEIVKYVEVTPGSAPEEVNYEIMTDDTYTCGYLGTLTDSLFTENRNPEQEEVYIIQFSPESTGPTYTYSYNLYVYDKGTYNKVE